MNTNTILSQLQIDELSGEYLNGEFDGVTGGKPNPLLWGNLQYQAGYCKGLVEYYNKKCQESEVRSHKGDSVRRM